MHILLITIPFYEYIPKIKQSIEINLTADVDVFFLYKKRNIFDYALDLVTKGYYTKKMQKKEQRCYFESFNDNYYDYILVIVGRGLDQCIFKAMLSHQKKAKCILYLWDNIDRIEEFNWMKSVFKYIYTFDDVDAKKYNLLMLPLFYCEEFEYKDEVKEYDLFFTGYNHTDREKIIHKILPYFCHGNLFVLLNTTRRKQILKMIRNHELKKPFYIQYKAISLKDNAEISKKSKIVLDMPFPGQNGLSIRTIETIASKAKLITTNSNVKKYNFYNESNICVIDRDNPIIDVDFIQKPFIQYSDSFIEKYSLNEWVRKLFCENTF